MYDIICIYNVSSILCTYAYVGREENKINKQNTHLEVPPFQPVVEVFKSMDLDATLGSCFGFSKALVRSFTRDS
jgi:hypothetical protein